MKKILFSFLVVLLTISSITYAQSIGKLTVSSFAKQIANSLFDGYMEIEYMKLGGKENYKLTEKIYQSEEFKISQNQALAQSLREFKGSKKALTLPKIDKSSTTKELISTIKYEFLKKLHQFEASKVGGMDNYQMVLGIYGSPQFKKTQATSLSQAVSQYDGSNNTQNTSSVDEYYGESADGFTRGTLTQKQIRSVLSGVVFAGTTSSKIVLIEYSDVECPFCQRHFSSKTVETVVENNKIKSIFKHFPLSFHSTAQKAAEAIECAGRQNKYLEFKNALFAASIDSSDKKPTIEIINSVERKLKLDQDLFYECLEYGQTSDKVSSDMNEGSTVFTVTGTPGNVLLNTDTGKYVVIAGAYPADSFDPVITELKK